MYENLKAEMARQNKNITVLAEETGINYQTLSEKLRGNFRFSFDEAMLIKKTLGVDMPLEELFANYEVVKDESNTD